MNHSDVQRSDEGVNVSTSVSSIGSSSLRRWGSRVVGAALLAAPMLLALGGSAQASELEPVLEDPITEVTEAVDPVVEETLETVTEAVDPVVDETPETVAEAVDPVRGIVDVVVSAMTETVGGIDEGRPFPPAPPTPPLRGTDPTLGSRTWPAFGSSRDTRRSDRSDAYGTLGPGSSSTTAMPQYPSRSVAAGHARPLGSRAPDASATAPFSSDQAFSAASLLLLLVAVMVLVRLFLPSSRSSRASRVVAWRSATLALSVERPG